jgi:hypothetical protein
VCSSDLGSAAPVDGLLPVDLKMRVFIDKPSELYVFVRDQLDDDASPHPYYITANYEAPPDGNGSFETSTPVVIGGSTVTDAIGYTGDTDCFSLNVVHAGVYDILADFDRKTGSGVRLNFAIYDSQGKLIEERKQGNDKITHMVHYLEPGLYYVTVYDDGIDDFDTSSLYRISVTENTVSEALANDTKQTATPQGTSMFAGASIDYYEDEDYYAIDSNVAGDVKVVNLTFSSDAAIPYQISLVNANTTIPEFTHEYLGGANGQGVYQVSVKLESAGNYYLMIKASNGAYVTGSCPYTAATTVTGISDPDEITTHAGTSRLGNNIDTDAVDLTSTPSHAGKVCFRGDADWYKVTFPQSTLTQKVLSLYLAIPKNERVQYAMKIVNPAVPGLAGEKIVYYDSVAQRNVDLKTGILVPMGTGTATYLVKIYDYQDNDSEDAPYTLTWGVNDIPAAPVACPKTGGNTATVYNSENNEGGFLKTVNIRYPDNTGATFKVNTSVFDLNDTVNTQKTGTNPVVVSFPWVSGYIDYQGDEDWYGLDLSQPLNPADTSWYYTISVEMYANGSPVEYTWEYLPDSNGDGQVNTQWCRNTDIVCPGGIMAGFSDTATALGLVDYSLMSTGYNNGSLWRGKGQSSGSIWYGMSYFRISDFNYLSLQSGNVSVVNPLPDNDWDNTVPYYFRLTVKYYSGSLQPPPPPSPKKR